MDELIRFGVSLPKKLLCKFDRFIHEKKYGSRSEALRDLIRNSLAETTWDDSKNICGVISLVYDHHHKHLLDKLTAAQHDEGEIILSSTHVHIDHHHCLEVIIVRGDSKKVKRLSEKMIAFKGVLHGSLTKAPTGAEF
jgi:CopG family nickel-responsive transcriptional regulator